MITILASRSLVIALGVMVFFQGARAEFIESTFDVPVKVDLVVTCVEKSLTTLSCSVGVVERQYSFQVVANRRKTDVSWGNVVGAIGASGGLLLPLVVFFPPRYGELIMRDVLVAKRDLLLEPIERGRVVIIHNGELVQESDFQGVFDVDVSVKGVYELVVEAKQFGLVKNHIIGRF